ncbi:MAG: DUF819 family protein [Phycisphaerae bacterium]|nr:DUF819 family protein [Phycisphaerae bacterium]
MAILMTLTGISAVFFVLAHKTGWRFFQYVPPLIFIYAIPMILSSTGVLTSKSPVYDWMGSHMLPFFLTLMLLKVDVASAIKVMGRGILVMLCGTAGVILGAPLAYWLVKGHLEPEAWKAFAVLAGSWIGGTGNMAAVSQGIEATGTDVGLAVLGDNVVIVVWLPILLASKNLSGRFHRFTRVNTKRVHMLEQIEADDHGTSGSATTRDWLVLFFLGFAVTWASGYASQFLREFPPVLTHSTWKILLVSTFGLALSMTPARKIAGSHEFAMALVFLFVARMGATADLSGLQAQAGWFVAGSLIWIFLHGVFCVLGAWLFRVDVHSTAIASAANIGGAASAPIVAAHHNPKLVPVSILMALMGYAIGNYGAFAAASLCAWVAQW